MRGYSEALSVLFLSLLMTFEGLLCDSLAKDKPFFETSVVASSKGAFPWNGTPCIATTPGQKLICTWEGGVTSLDERIVGALSVDGGHTWSPPVTLIRNPGKLDADPNLVIDGKRILVLSTTHPVPGRIITTETWMVVSEDEGETWSKPVSVTHPHRFDEGKHSVGYKLKDGRLAVPYSWDTFCERGMSPATEGEEDIRAGLLFSSDGGYHWTAGGDIYARPPKTTPDSVNGMDEPATVVLENGEIFALLRTGTDHLWESWSKDSGATWSTPKPSPLVSHNSPAALWRLRGTNDVVVVWDNSPRYRWPLTVALSQDGCRTWSKPKVIVDPQGLQASYPSLTQTSDGTIVVVWQEALADPKVRDIREIRQARFNRAWLLER